MTRKVCVECKSLRHVVNHHDAGDATQDHGRFPLGVLLTGVGGVRRTATPPNTLGLDGEIIRFDTVDTGR